MHMPIAFRMLQVENLIKLTQWVPLPQAQRGLLPQAQRPQSSSHISC
jgi:hypothetical protein